MVERILSRILGESYPREMNTPMPPGLCVVKVLEDQHHPYWVR